MSVILNESGILALFERPTVVAFVERVTKEKVVTATQQAVVDYFHTAPSLNVDQDVDLEMRGSSAVVGIRDTRSDLIESKGRRLARTGLIQKWLTAAVDEARI